MSCGDDFGGDSDGVETEEEEGGGEVEEEQRVEKGEAREEDQVFEEWTSELTDISWMFAMAAALLPNLDEQRNKAKRGRPPKEDFKPDDIIHEHSHLFVITVVEMFLRFCVR
jgi:hypothetical protein